MFKPAERIMSAGEWAAYERYVEWRAERAALRAEENYQCHMDWLEASRVAEATRRASALACVATERTVAREAAVQAAARHQQDAACEAEKARRAERIAARMRSLGFRHPHAQPVLKVRR